MPQPSALCAKSLVGLIYAPVANKRVQSLLLALNELLGVKGEDFLCKEAATHLLDLDLVLLWQV
jgi:hypothetical protein